MNPNDLKIEPGMFALDAEAGWTQWQRSFEKQQALIDPVGMYTPIANAHLAWLAHPQQLAQWMARTTGEIMALQAHAARRFAGATEDDRVMPNADDLRSSDPVWTQSPGWDLLKQWYLLFTRNIQDALFHAPGVAPKERRRAAFWWRKWLNGIAR